MQVLDYSKIREMIVRQAEKDFTNATRFVIKNPFEPDIMEALVGEEEQSYFIHIDGEKVSFVLTKMTSKKRLELKERVLREQNGKCAICLRGNFCPKCSNQTKHSVCKIQTVNTLDHNHNAFCAQRGCLGCEKCIRCITHVLCNRVLPMIERNEHLQSEFIKKYLTRGMNQT